MEEQFKLFKTTNHYGCKLNYYISNFCNIILETPFGRENLSIGHGLYIEKKYPNLKLCGHTQDLYRIIWELFKGPIPKGHQIHHLDYNHCNNRLDNLICCSAKEHGKYHGFLYKYQNILKYDNAKPLTDIEKEQLEQYNKVLDIYKQYKDISNNKDNIYKEWRQYINNLYNKLDNIHKEQREQREQQREQQRRQKELDKQKKIEEKLKSGNYKLTEDGKLRYILTGTKWSEERRQKTMKTRQETMYGNPQWKANMTKGVIKYYNDHPEAKKEISVRSKKVMEDQSIRDRISKKVKEYHQSKKTVKFC